MDAESRDRTRRFRSSHTLADEAALLRTRVRAGSLSSERLELAAHLGDGAALRALGATPAAESLAAWVEGLERWGREALVRAAVACARLALSERNRRLPSDDLPSRWRAVEAARAWLTCPCPAHEHEADFAASFTPDARPADAPYQPELLGAWTHAALAAGGSLGVGARDHAVAAAVNTAGVIDEPAVREAVLRELLPWALPPDD